MECSGKQLETGFVGTGLGSMQAQGWLWHLRKPRVRTSSLVVALEETGPNTLPLTPATGHQPRDGPSAPSHPTPAPLVRHPSPGLWELLSAQ